MPYWVKINGGAFISSPQAKLHVKLGGVWTEVVYAFAKSGGVWSKFHEGIAYPLPANTTYTDLRISPLVPSVSFNLGTDGNGSVTRAGGATVNFDYRTPNEPTAGSNLWVKVTVGTGSFSSGASTGVWLPLGSGPYSWTRNRSSVGTSSVEFTVQLATDAFGVNVVASRTYTLSATMSL